VCYNDRTTGDEAIGLASRGSPEDLLERALETVLSEGGPRTPVLGGGATTTEVGEAIAQEVARKPRCSGSNLETTVSLWDAGHSTNVTLLIS
jgi:hypothetical protein